jgi:hypothetical protein
MKKQLAAATGPSHHHTQQSRSINSIQISLPSSIQTLTDTDLRQQLSDGHHRIIQQYKNEMKTIFTETNEVKLRETQQFFDDEMTKMWHDQRALSIDQRLNPIIIAIIDRHLLLITDKIQCIYHYRNAILNA